MVHILLLIIYMAFISLGLPDGLLGAAWPAIHLEMGLNVSYMGMVSLIISVGTVIASLFADPLCRRFTTAKVTAFSVAMTAAALFGFAFADSIWLLCLWAIPYGLGAGAVDACLNNYVAIHYAGKHMSWLHCMWGLGAASGPYIMGAVLAGGLHWSNGYLYIGVGQAVLVAVLILTLRIWKTTGQGSEEQGAPLSLKQVIALPGAKYVLVAFFCYCALEQTIGQWAASYFFGYLDTSAELSATLAGIYYMGITVGRAVNGFLTVRFSDKQLVRAGMAAIAAGIAVMFLPLGVYGAVAGIILVGLGSAPIYPCIIHSTPALFGTEQSGAIIGIEMAAAYIGICVMPPLFGVIADWLGVGTLPWVLSGLLIIMYVSHEQLYMKRKKRNLFG